MENEYRISQLIPTNAGTIDIVPKNGTDYELEELQAYVDGYIEIVYLDDKTIMVVNEEGKDVLPYNKEATELAHKYRAIYSTDYICGTAIVCDTEMVK